MKRYLKNDRYQLDDRAAESMWYRIRGEVAGTGAAPVGRRATWRPALAVAASLAVMTVLGSWWLAGDRLEQTLSPDAPAVALRQTTTETRIDAPHPDENIVTTEAIDAEVGGANIAAVSGPISDLTPPPSEERDPAATKAAARTTDKIAARAVAPTVADEDASPPPVVADEAVTPVRRETVAAAPAPAPAQMRASVAATPDRSGVIHGRVRDSQTGAGLAFANVLLKGTTRGVVTDSTGAFSFAQLEPGNRYELQVMLLSYDPLDVAVIVPDTGVITVACNLEPMVVATLQSFDVEGAEYSVEVKSSIQERTVDSETFEKYAIDSVEDALSQQSGVVGRAGELHAPGGRSGEVSLQKDGKAVPNPLGGRAPASIALTPPKKVVGETWGGSVTGGTRPPNGEKYELMYHEHTGVNPFIATAEDALSTFALDVDNASFTLARNYLDRGVMPPRAAIRVEEFVNALDAGWPVNTDTTFKLHADGGNSRYGDGYHLLRVGVVGRSVDKQQRKPANLVFVIDISGSMNREARLGSVKRALRTLVNELGEGDRVGLVVYGSRGEVRLSLTDVSRRESILAAIEALQPGGSTNAAEGLQLAYRMAREQYEPGAINRLVLCSDGVANTGGATDAEGILHLVRRASDEGITLSTVGFGMGNYNDVLMEKLADQGDGNYFYVDRPAEAERVFRENLTGLLQTIARETKVQVEFDPRVVTRWRLLGYENRDVADRDFRNDAVDAGEVGAGHQVTALYEVKLVDPPAAVANIGHIDEDDDAHRIERAGTIRLRWEAPAHDTAHAGQVTEIEQKIPLSLFAMPADTAAPQHRAQALAAEFAEILRGSYWAKESRLVDLVPVADALVNRLPENTQVRDLARMIRRAADLQAEPVLPGSETSEDNR